MTHLQVVNNEISSMCSVCKGKCCKRMPGIYISSQFPDFNVSVLNDLLNTEKFAIDWWVDSVPIYYLRPRIKGEKAICGSWGGECINLTDTGCSLKFDDRPNGCQALIPNYDFEKNTTSCYSKGMTKKEQIDTWLPYQKVFQTVVLQYE